MAGIIGGEPWSQAATRRGGRMTDTHGRTWWAEFEKKSGFPVGGFIPEFQAPWYPDQQYLKVDPDVPTRMTIDYPGMLTDRMRAHEAYHQLARSEALNRNLPLPEQDGEPYDRRILDIVGRPPKPVEPIIAAMQGNPWILGFTKTPDPRLQPLVVKARDVATTVQLPDFSAESYAELVDDDAFADLEEAVDPDATGGKTVRVPRKRGRPPKVQPVTE